MRSGKDPILGGDAWFGEPFDCVVRHFVPLQRAPLPAELILELARAYPLTAPAVSPPTRNFCSAKNNTITGAEMIKAPAAK